MLMMKRGNKETPFQFKKGLYRITVYGGIRPYFDGSLRHHTVPSTVPYDKDFNHRQDGYRYRIYGHRTTVNTVTVYSLDMRRVVNEVTRQRQLDPNSITAKCVTPSSHVF